LRIRHSGGVKIEGEKVYTYVLSLTLTVHTQTYRLLQLLWTYPSL